MLVDRSLNFWHILWNFIALDGTCMWAFSGERRAVCLVCRSVMHQGGACMWAFSRRRDWSSLQSQNDPGVFVTYWQHPLRFIEQPIKKSNRWSSVEQLLIFLCWIYFFSPGESLSKLPPFILLLRNCHSIYFTIVKFLSFYPLHFFSLHYFLNFIFSSTFLLFLMISFKLTP